MDVLFFCMGHGKSAQFLQEHEVPASVRIVDLAQDFRLAAPGNDYVYGLPELNRDSIAGALHVANPGCFATAIQLALLPLAKAGLLTENVLVNALTGSTGAGVKPSATTHFSWRSNNLSVYKVFRHQHVAEIRQSLTSLQPSFEEFDLDFIPYRGDFPRGIFATAFLHTTADQATVDEAFAQFTPRRRLRTTWPAATSTSNRWSIPTRLSCMPRYMRANCSLPPASTTCSRALPARPWRT